MGIGKSQNQFIPYLKIICHMNNVLKGIHNGKCPELIWPYYISRMYRG